MRLTIKLDREVDGRWMADVPELPGVSVYAASEESAVNAAKALALRVLADRLEQDEPPFDVTSLSFTVAA